MGKVAVITGASRGIGRGVALYFAEQGFNVALIARSKDALEQLAEDIKSSYQVDAQAYPIDVTNVTDVNTTISSIHNKWQHIDILFNNAGVFHQGTSDISLENFNQTIDVNLRGAFYLVQAVTPYLKQQQSGYIFNLASRAGKVALANTGAYAMSKFGLVGFNESLFRELAPFNIKVTALCPSVVATDMTSEFVGFEEEDKIQVADITKTVDYLLSLGDAACVQDIVIQCSHMLKNPQKLLVK